jgi:hypothetical protein
MAAESWVAKDCGDPASGGGSDMMVALFDLERVGVVSSGENIVGVTMVGRRQSCRI